MTIVYIIEDLYVAGNEVISFTIGIDIEIRMFLPTQFDRFPNILYGPSFNYVNCILNLRYNKHRDGDKHMLSPIPKNNT